MRRMAPSAEVDHASGAESLGAAASTREASTAPTSPDPDPGPAFAPPHHADRNGAGVTPGALADQLKRYLPSREAVLAEARAQTEAQTRRRSRTRQAAGTVASLLVLGWVVWQDPVWQSETLTTAVGQQRRHALADGSRVTLNTDSRLTVERRLLSRRLVLHRGEVAFTVTAGWRPFIVTSGDIAVRDIGTTFAVRRLDDGSQVTVLQGAVEVSVREAGARGSPASSPAIVLTQGERLRTRDGPVPESAGPDPAASVAAFPVEAVDVIAAGAWQQGRLVFDGTPLRDAVAEIQRYLPEPITLADAETGDLRLSGVHDILGIRALLDSLPRALPVRLEPRADGGVLIRRIDRRGRIRNDL